jgi:hypothetical protein
MKYQRIGSLVGGYKHSEGKIDSTVCRKSAVVSLLVVIGYSHKWFCERGPSVIIVLP